MSPIVKGRYPSPGAMTLLIALGVVLFCLSIILQAYDDSPEATGVRSAPGAHSVSAIGHAGFYDTLRRLNRNVMRSSGDSLSMAGRRGTLVLAEPDLNHVDSEDTLMLTSAPRILLVLPKWRGTPDEDKPSWISSVRPLPGEWATRTLGLVDARSEVHRREWPEEWRINDLGITPAMRPDPAAPDSPPVVQLIRSSTMQPIVASKNGILVGEIMEGNQKIWVLSDPDIMNNYGIGEGDNALFMVELMDRLRSWNNDDQRAPIVFDETIHGYRAAKTTPLKLLFRFPFSLFTFLVCGTAVLAVLAGSGRFGAPIKLRPELDFGKRGLITNGSRLLDYSGHHASVLRRYVRMTVRATAKTLHAPAGLDEPALAAWLDIIGRERGVTRSCSEILAEVDSVSTDNPSNLSRLFTDVWDIHIWKGEILYGTGHHQ